MDTLAEYIYRYGGNARDALEAALQTIQSLRDQFCIPHATTKISGDDNGMCPKCERIELSDKLEVALRERNEFSESLSNRDHDVVELEKQLSVAQQSRKRLVWLVRAIHADDKDFYTHLESISKTKIERDAMRAIVETARKFDVKQSVLDHYLVESKLKLSDCVLSNVCLRDAVALHEEFEKLDENKHE